MERWNALWKEKKFLILAVILLLGIMFLFLGEYNSHRTGNEDEATAATEAQALEERLRCALEQMEGVSDVHVLVMLQESVSAQSTSVYEGKSTSAPVIRGVSVICQGAKNIHVKRKIILLIASTLNLNENQIYVSE